MIGHRTSVGLDVHARSVVGCALDGDTGEVWERRLTPNYQDIWDWLRSLPGPVAVTYEAGPTGFGLARFLIAAGVLCLVGAPSKLQRPSGDRVKTDARDAAHLARLLHLGQIVEVSVPSAEQEAARDLVRAREDCRGDLMSSRHRVSKLLLRQGIVYCGGRTWTGKHEGWLRGQRFDAAPLQLAYDTALDTMLATVDRRNRLDEAPGPRRGIHRHITYQGSGLEVFPHLVSGRGEKSEQDRGIGVPGRDLFYHRPALFEFAERGAMHPNDLFSGRPGGKPGKRPVSCPAAANAFPCLCMERGCYSQADVQKPDAQIVDLVL